MLKKLIIIVMAVGIFSVGCAMARAPLSGVWYTNVKSPEGVTASVGTKTGEACATSILGLFATGDASVESAKKAGDISEVSSVDSHSTSILGLYATFCTTVTGK